MGTVQGYPAVRIAPKKRQKVDDCRVVSFLAPAVDVNWIPCAAHKKISEVDCDYWLYRGIVNDDAGQPDDVSADVVDDLDYVFAQEELRMGGEMAGRYLQPTIASFLP